MKTVFDVLAEKLEEESQSYKNRLMAAGFKTLEDYKYEAGVYRGLTLAINIIKDLANKIEDQLDE